MQKGKNYVDKEQFYQLIVAYKTACAKAKKLKQIKPQIPDAAGEILLKMANKLSLRYNFINYSYRDEMVSDGIENCVMYFDYFDPAKSRNPFGYFTQVMFFAFMRRINREKKQSYIKNKMLERKIIDMILEKQEGEQDESGNLLIGHQDIEAINELNDKFEKGLTAKKKKAIVKDADRVVVVTPKQPKTKNQETKNEKVDLHSNGISRI
jgi:hypothetical protein